MILVLLLDFQLIRGRIQYRLPAATLPGAALLHESADQDATYVALIDEVEHNCDMLFTLPGMNSLNL